MKTIVEFIETDKGQLKLTTYFINKFQGCQCHNSNCGCSNNFTPYIYYRLRKQWGKPKVEYSSNKEELIQKFLRTYQITKLCK